MKRIVAVKSYGFEWMNTYRLSADDAAAKLEALGVTWLLVQNLLDPLPGSAVDQAPPAAGYDDRRFRDALRSHGLRIFEATAVFFQPSALRNDPSLRPIDESGAPFAQFGWYAGLCPSSPEYLSSRAALCEEVVSTLEPDGIFLSFIRFPGFWEMWMPETPRSTIREYCFCARCTAKFEADTGNALPVGPIARRAAILQHELRDEWTRWKCGVVTDTVATLRAAAQRVRPGVEVMINGLALGRGDYGNAVMEVLGQDIAALSGPADHFELMFYHQILRRDPVPWIRSMTAEARGRTSRTLLACLQGRADYVQPMYAAGRRRPEIPIEEFEAAVDAVAGSAADGVMVYHWKDFLEDELRGAGSMARAIRAYREGRPARGGHVR